METTQPLEIYVKPSLDEKRSTRILVLSYRQYKSFILAPDVIAAHPHQNPPVFCAICAGPTSESRILIGPAEEKAYVTPEEATGGLQTTHGLRKVRMPAGFKYIHATKFKFNDGRWQQYRDFGPGLYSGIYHLNTSLGWPSFPLCQDCFSILPAFMGHRLRRASYRQNNDITSPETLYYRLRHQFLKDPETQARDLRLDWPDHAYVGQTPEWIYNPQRRTWRTEPTWRCASFSQPIPSLPTYLLSKLSPMTASTQKAVSFHTPSPTMPRLSQSSPLITLPPELLNQILSSLPYSTLLSLRLTSTHMHRAIPLNQKFWYKAFMDKELFSFLLSHDSQDVVREVESKVLRRGLGPGRYDWIGFVRALADWGQFREGGVFEDAPGGFVNRRRVWRVLGGMEMEENGGKLEDVPRINGIDHRSTCGD